MIEDVEVPKPASNNINTGFAVQPVFNRVTSSLFNDSSFNDIYVERQYPIESHEQRSGDKRSFDELKDLISNLPDIITERLQQHFG